MATQEVLQEIRDKLGDLPERLSRVLSKSPQRDEKGRFLPQGASSPQGATEVPGIPNKWQSSERFAHALGRFLPGAGQVGSLMSGIRELRDSWGNLRSAFSSREAPAPGRFKSSKPDIPASSGNPVNIPSLPTKFYPPVPTTAQIPSSGGQSNQAGFTQAPGFRLFQELITEMKALREEVRRMREAARQNEPDQADDSERAPKVDSIGSETETKGGSLASKLVPMLTHANRVQEKISGAMRPEKKVPSNNDSGNGTMEKVMAIAKLLI